MKSSHPAAGWNERASLRGTRGKTASEGGVVEWKKGWRVEGSRYKKSSRIKSRGCTLVKGEKRVVGVRLAWSPVITFSSFLFLSPPLVIPRGGCSSPPFLLDSSPLGDLLLVHRLSTFLACNYWPLNEGRVAGATFENLLLEITAPRAYVSRAARQIGIWARWEGCTLVRIRGGRNPSPKGDRFVYRQVSLRRD